MKYFILVIKKHPSSLISIANLYFVFPPYKYRTHVVAVVPPTESEDDPAVYPFMFPSPSLPRRA